jgi:hypothetical protein
VVCRACGFNRRYCTDTCAAVAHARSVRAAQQTYRAKPAVRDRHREEERARRARRRAERVGDHILRHPRARGSVEGVVAPKAIVVAAAAPAPVATPPALLGAPPAPVAAPPKLVAVPPAPAAAPCTRPAGQPAGAQWRLVVGHALSAQAEDLRRRGAWIRCACCGRAGRVAAVVIRAELGWRRESDEDGA